VAWVARMERSVIRGQPIPDCAEFIIGPAKGRTRWLHPGYQTKPELKQSRRERPSAEAVSVAVMRFSQETTESLEASGRFSVEAADHPGVGLGVSLRAEARSLQPRSPGCSGR
jgi:hypothetical protein